MLITLLLTQALVCLGAPQVPLPLGDIPSNPREVPLQRSPSSDGVAYAVIPDDDNSAEDHMTLVRTWINFGTEDTPLPVGRTIDPHSMTQVDLGDLESHARAHISLQQPAETFVTFDSRENYDIPPYLQATLKPSVPAAEETHGVPLPGLDQQEFRDVELHNPHFRVLGLDSGSDEDLDYDIDDDFHDRAIVTLTHADTNEERLGLSEDVLANRYNFVDEQGSIKWGYRTEDQHQNQVINNDGTYTGDFGWVTPDGQHISVKYIAGADIGYKILESTNYLPVHEENIKARNEHIETYQNTLRHIEEIRKARKGVPLHTSEIEQTGKHVTEQFPITKQDTIPVDPPVLPENNLAVSHSDNESDINFLVTLKSGTPLQSLPAVPTVGVPLPIPSHTIDFSLSDSRSEPSEGHVTTEIQDEVPLSGLSTKEIVSVPEIVIEAEDAIIDSNSLGVHESPTHVSITPHVEVVLPLEPTHSVGVPLPDPTYPVIGVMSTGNEAQAPVLAVFLSETTGAELPRPTAPVEEKNIDVISFNVSNLGENIEAGVNLAIGEDKTHFSSISPIVNVGVSLPMPSDFVSFSVDESHGGTIPDKHDTGAILSATIETQPPVHEVSPDEETGVLLPQSTLPVNGLVESDSGSLGSRTTVGLEFTPEVGISHTFQSSPVENVGVSLPLPDNLSGIQVSETASHDTGLEGLTDTTVHHSPQFGVPLSTDTHTHDPTFQVSQVDKKPSLIDARKTVVVESGIGSLEHHSNIGVGLDTHSYRAPVLSVSRVQDVGIPLPGFDDAQDQPVLETILSTISELTENAPEITGTPLSETVGSADIADGRTELGVKLSTKVKEASIQSPPIVQDVGVPLPVFGDTQDQQIPEVTASTFKEIQQPEHAPEITGIPLSETVGSADITEGHPELGVKLSTKTEEALLPLTPIEMIGVPLPISIDELHDKDHETTKGRDQLLNQLLASAPDPSLFGVPLPIPNMQVESVTGTLDDTSNNNNNESQSISHDQHTLHSLFGTDTSLKHDSHAIQETGVPLLPELPKKTKSEFKDAYSGKPTLIEESLTVSLEKAESIEAVPVSQEVLTASVEKKPPELASSGLSQEAGEVETPSAEFPSAETGGIDPCIDGKKHPILLPPECFEGVLDTKLAASEGDYHLQPHVKKQELGTQLKPIFDLALDTGVPLHTGITHRSQVVPLTVVNPEGIALPRKDNQFAKSLDGTPETATEIIQDDTTLLTVDEASDDVEVIEHTASPGLEDDTDAITENPEETELLNENEIRLETEVDQKDDLVILSADAPEDTTVDVPLELEASSDVLVILSADAPEDTTVDVPLELEASSDSFDLSTTLSPDPELSS